MNPGLFLFLVVLGIALVCWLVAFLADDRVVVEIVDEEPAIPAADQCQVTECPREWQTDRNGWRLCHHHHTQMVTHRGGAA